MIDDLASTRELLEMRYDEIKSGRIELIPDEEIEACFREKSLAARRTKPTK